uniref:N-acetylneuraminic acid phosphatase n=1 Tax=Anolis carolinensis TaxID=28377 RepID=A0A803U1G7_ANOCA|nr:PREDICTED: N-acylneuraminate-9-phosphatase [Anolis carolinensis]|eukprot:XP_003215976.1 PREDICTED: N-acylneuraminate-9-phosphatase [Anolis carolinensis]
MGLQGVKAVFFDLDNTLVDTAGAGSKAIQEVINVLQSKYHYDEKEACMICDEFQAKLHKEYYDPSKMCITDLRIQHWEDAIQEVKGGTAKHNLAADCYFLWKTTRLQHLTLAEETQGMLSDLRKVVQLLLLTNGDTQTQREKIEACACQQYFNAIVVGGEHKEEKPAPSIFHHCCELLKVRPEDCVMVGDSLDTDIQGGLNAGLKATVWVNKAIAAPKPTSPIPHYIISSVHDFPELLHNKGDSKSESNKVADICNECEIPTEKSRTLVC